MSVSSAGLAMDTTVTSGGIMNVLSGGSATNIIASNGAHLGIAVAPNTYAQGAYNSSAFIMSSASISNYTIHSGCTLDVLTGGVASDTTVLFGGRLNVSSGGTATAINAASGALLGLTVASNTYVSGSYNNSSFNISSSVSNYTIYSGCSLDVLSGGGVSAVRIQGGGIMSLSSGAAIVGEVKLGGRMIVESPISFANATVNYTLDYRTPQSESLISNLGNVSNLSSLGIQISRRETYGSYTLASNTTTGNAVVMYNMASGGTSMCALSSGVTNASATDLHRSYTMTNSGGVITMGVSGAYTRCDFQPNGISDVIFLESGSQHRVGYWLDGTNDWVAETSLAFDWDVLGGYDMNSDHRADLLVYNVSGGSATIGYYESGDMSHWQTIGFRNVTSAVWDLKAGNLTGNAGKNSLVWHDMISGTLDVWTDGTTSVTQIGSNYTGSSNPSSGWAMQGCGDFDGDGKDSVLMTQNGGLFYSVDLDGTQTSLGDLNWSGWEVRAIGDFASMVGNVYTVGDGKDDVVLFHEETGAMVKLVNGNANNYESIGQLAAGDWFMAGCGDYNGDQKDDLLVRQYSTGMLGYYSEGIQDTAHWNNMGYGVDMNWTVIA